jgi:hypothetical protein
MSATDPIDFQRRVGQGTPEQRAAIEQVLRAAPGEPGGGGKQDDQSGQAADTNTLLDALMRVERKLDAVLAWIAEARVEPEIRVSEHEAKRVFLLMQRLESGLRQRKASLGTVFRLLVLEGVSQRAVAARCGCAKSLISRRVVAIERAFGMRLERLRSYASALLSLEAAAKGERTRKKQGDLPEMTEDEGDEEER